MPAPPPQIKMARLLMYNVPEIHWYCYKIGVINQFYTATEPYKVVTVCDEYPEVTNAEQDQLQEF